MVMRALRDGASKGVLKFFLLGLLALAGGGLVFTDVGGFFRGGVSSGDVAKIGNETISAQAFNNKLRDTLQNYNMTPDQALQSGLIKQIVEGEIRTSLARQAANDYGVNPGTALIAEEIKTSIAPMVQPGQNASEVLEQILRSRGLSQGQLVNNIKTEISVNALSQSIQAGFAGGSGLMIEDLARLSNETRKIEYIHFKDEDYKGTVEISDEDLLGLYEKSKELYIIPEMRSGQLVIIKTDQIKNTTAVSDDEVKATYDENINAYSFPETRKVEQVLIGTEEDGIKIAELVKKGTSLKDALEKISGNTTDYLPAKYYAESEIDAELQTPVFKGKKGDIIGPVETGLGYQVAVINDIKEPRTESFDSVKDELRKEILENKIIDAQYDIANTADDLLASGLTAEELKEELDIETIDIPKINRFGLDEKNQNVLKNFEASQAEIFKTLFELAEGEGSPVFELPDGRLAAIILSTVTPKSYKPFENIKDQLRAQAKIDNRRLDNRKEVGELRAAILLGGKTLESAGKSSTLSLKRSDAAKAPITPAAMANIFEAPVGEPIIIDLDGGPALAQVVSSDIPETISEAERTATKDALANEMHSEGYGLFIDAQNKKHKAKINERLLQQMYSAQDSQ